MPEQYTTSAAARRTREFNKEHRWRSRRGTLLTRRLRAIGLTVQTAQALDVLEGICKSCWDNEAFCFCDCDE